MSSQKPFTSDLVVRLLARIFRHFNAIDESCAVDVLLVLLRCRGRGRRGRGSGDRIDITPHNLRCTLQAMCHAPYSMHTRPKWPRDVDDGVDSGARTSHATFALRILKLPLARATWLDCSCAMKVEKKVSSPSASTHEIEEGQRDRETDGHEVCWTEG